MEVELKLSLLRKELAESICDEHTKMRQTYIAEARGIELREKYGLIPEYALSCMTESRVSYRLAERNTKGLREKIAKHEEKLIRLLTREREKDRFAFLREAESIEGLKVS